MNVGGLAERHVDGIEDLLADGFWLLRVIAVGEVDVDGLPAILRGGEDVAERDVVLQVAVVVDGEPVDGVGVKCVGVRIRVEDQNRARGIGRRLERIQIAQIESLIAERWAETQTGEVVGHIASIRAKIGVRPCFRCTR